MSIDTRAVEYTQGDTLFEGVLARDKRQAGQRPAVLVFHGWEDRSDTQLDFVKKLELRGLRLRPLRQGRAEHDEGRAPRVDIPTALHRRVLRLGLHGHRCLASRWRLAHRVDVPGSMGR